MKPKGTIIYRSNTYYGNERSRVNDGDRETHACVCESMPRGYYGHARLYKMCIGRVNSIRMRNY